MKRHYIEDRSVMLAYSACGIHRAALEPKAETRLRYKVSCGNCKKILKARSKRK